MAGQSRTLKLSILADVDKLKQSLNVGSKDVDGFAGKIGDFSKKAALAFAAVAAAAGAMAIKIGVDAVKAASDLSETVAKVGVLFGDTADDIEKFANGAASSLGQTKQQALDAAATFATFGKAAGLSGQDLSKFSIDFVKLSSDLASFNNTSPEQAINAIGSALRGEAEPLRAYGVLLDDASLRQAALELGIINTTKNALTPQQKVLAAQALIYQQTGAAQGDFERTSDGLANKTRILTAQLENAKVTIGEALLPIVLELATLFSEKVIPIVQQVAAAFGENQDGLGGTLNTVANGIKSFVQPIFNGFKKAFDSIKDTIVENKDEFEKFFNVIKAAAPILGNVIGAAFEVIGKVASVVLNVIANVVGAIQGLLNTAIDGINQVIRGLNLIKPGSDIKYLTKIGTSSAAGSSGFSGTMPGGQTFSTNTSVAAAAATNAAIDAAAKRDTAAAAAQAAKTAAVVARTKAQADTTGILAARTAAQNASRAVNASLANLVGGVPTFDPGSFRMFEERTSGTPIINITVNGAIDREGTARTIVETLNDSFYRGTGGAGSLQIA
jgi:hypothetical protein